MKKLEKFIIEKIGLEFAANPRLEHKIAACLLNLLPLRNDIGFDKKFKADIELVNLSERPGDDSLFGLILIDSQINYLLVLLDENQYTEIVQFLQNHIINCPGNLEEYLCRKLGIKPLSKLPIIDPSPYWQSVQSALCAGRSSDGENFELRLDRCMHEDDMVKLAQGYYEELGYEISVSAFPIPRGLFFAKKERRKLQILITGGQNNIYFIGVHDI